MQYRTKLSVMHLLIASAGASWWASPVSDASEQPLGIDTHGASASADFWDDALIAILTSLCAVIGCEGVLATPVMMPSSDAESQADVVVRAYASNGVLASATTGQMEEGVTNVDRALEHLEASPPSFDATTRVELEGTLIALRSDLVERLKK